VADGDPAERSGGILFWKDSSGRGAHLRDLARKMMWGAAMLTKSLPQATFFFHPGEAYRATNQLINPTLPVSATSVVPLQPYRCVGIDCFTSDQVALFLSSDEIAQDIRP
jgi:hypothetical protein